MVKVDAGVGMVESPPGGCKAAWQLWWRSVALVGVCEAQRRVVRHGALLDGFWRRWQGFGGGWMLKMGFMCPIAGLGCRAAGVEMGQAVEADAGLI